MFVDQACSLEGEPLSGLSVEKIVSKYVNEPRGKLAELVSLPENVQDFKWKTIRDHCSMVTGDDPQEETRFKLRCWDNLDTTPPESTLFVLIHGLGGSLDQFEPLMKLLNLHHKSAIALDLPGFGGSDTLSENVKYDMDHVANIVKKVIIQKVGNFKPKLNIVGHSMGNYINTHLVLALDPSYKVQNVIMCAPPAPHIPVLDKNNWKMQWVFRTMLRAPVLFDWYRSFFDRSYGLEGTGIKNFFYEEEGGSDKNVLLQYRKLCQFSTNIKNSSYIFFSYLIGWITPDWKAFSNVLSKQGSKLTIIYCENDKVVTEAGTKQLFDAFIDIPESDKTLIKVEKCGHNLFYNAPEKLCTIFEENFMF